MVMPLLVPTAGANCVWWKRANWLSWRQEQLSPIGRFMNRHSLVVVLRFLVVLSSLVSLACEPSSSAEKKSSAEPRGPEKSEERAVEQFEGVFAQGKIQVAIKRGSLSPARLSGPANYLKDITLSREERTVNGRKISTLVVSLKKGVKTPLPLVELTTPGLILVEADGPSKATVGDFSGPEMTILAKGAARVELEQGAYGRLDARAEHAARILAKGVMAEVAHASATGEIARVFLGQVGQLKKEASGGGSVTYEGNPEFIK
jgi:hypothetical protein